MNTTPQILKAPYPYFGGKSRVMREVWRRFGEVRNAVDPFMGSAAFFLGRPQPFDGTETANDINGWVCNFWRAVQANPDAVAHHADWPCSELDIHARGDAIFYRGWETAAGEQLTPDEFIERLRADENWFDPKCAGWWVWGQCNWIGDNWGRVSHNSKKDAEGNSVGVVQALPHLNRGLGVNRKLPAIDDGGEPIEGYTTTERSYMICAYMRQLAERIRNIRFCCGDWSRVCGKTPTIKLGLTAVFLDSPYAVDDRDSVYGEEESRTVAHDVRAWAIEWQYHPLMRIAICGYEEHDELAHHGWDKFAWKACGGYGSQNLRGNENAKRETVFFSPNCLKPDAMLF